MAIGLWQGESSRKIFSKYPSKTTLGQPGDLPDLEAIFFLIEPE